MPTISDKNFYHNRKGLPDKDENAISFSAYDIVKSINEEMQVLTIDDFSGKQKQDIGYIGAYIFPPSVKTGGLYFKVRVPPYIKPFSQIIPLIRWIPKTASTKTTVKLKLKMTTVTNIGEKIQTPIVNGTKKTLPKKNFEENSTVISIFDPFTLQSDELDQLLVFEIIRDGVNDTYLSDIGIFDVYILYESV